MGMGLRGFWGRIWGVLGRSSGDSGGKSDARRSLGGADFAEFRRRKATGRLLPCRSAAKAFFGPARGGAGPRWDRVYRFSMQTGRSGFNRRDSKDQDDCFLGYLYV